MLYATFNAAFTALVVLAAIFSSKLVPISETLVLPAGLLVMPLTLAISALVTEIYGAKKARWMVFSSLGICIFCTLLIQAALKLPAENLAADQAFRFVLGPNLIIVSSSLIAFFVSQLGEIYTLALLKGFWGEGRLWLRVLLAALFSQIIDSAIVNFGYLSWGLGMNSERVWEAVIFSTAYKVIAGISMTPLIYLVLFLKKCASSMILKPAHFETSKPF